jgi:hypothetical protein
MNKFMGFLTFMKGKIFELNEHCFNSSEGINSAFRGPEDFNESWCK